MQNVIIASVWKSQGIGCSLGNILSNCNICSNCWRVWLASERQLYLHSERHVLLYHKRWAAYCRYIFCCFEWSKLIFNADSRCILAGNTSEFCWWHSPRTCVQLCRNLRWCRQGRARHSRGWQGYCRLYKRHTFDAYFTKVHITWSHSIILHNCRNAVAF